MRCCAQNSQLQQPINHSESEITMQVKATTQLRNLLRSKTFLHMPAVYDALTNLCDEHEVAGLRVIPIATLRQLRPPGHGL